MGATNQPTPVILDDEALAEIETRPSFWPSHDEWRETPPHKKHVILEAGERDALCQTVRAAWAQVNEWESHRDGIIEAVKTAEARVEELEESNTALREQLAEVRIENERLAQQLKEWQEEKDTKAGYL